MAGLVLFGAQAFAEIAHYYFTHDSPYTVAGFTVDAAYLRETTCHGLPVVPFADVERHFPPSAYDMFVAVGIRQVNAARAAKVAEAEAKGYRLASFLSSKAEVGKDLQLEPNTMIMERAWFHPFVKVGRDTVIWSSTKIALRSRVGDHCWLTGATLGESVQLGDYSFVGLNATIASYVKVGRSNVIGAGALILKDTKDLEVYRGLGSKPSRAPSNRLKNF